MAPTKQSQGKQRQPLRIGNRSIKFSHVGLFAKCQQCEVKPNKMFGRALRQSAGNHVSPRPLPTMNSIENEKKPIGIFARMRQLLFPSMATTSPRPFTETTVKSPTSSPARKEYEIAQEKPAGFFSSWALWTKSESKSPIRKEKSISLEPSEHLKIKSNTSEAPVSIDVQVEPTDRNVQLPSQNSEMKLKLEEEATSSSSRPTTPVQETATSNQKAVCTPQPQDAIAPAQETAKSEMKLEEGATNSSRPVTPVQDKATSIPNVVCTPHDATAPAEPAKSEMETKLEDGATNSSIPTILIEETPIPIQNVVCSPHDVTAPAIAEQPAKPEIPRRRIAPKIEETMRNFEAPPVHKESRSVCPIGIAE